MEELTKRLRTHAAYADVITPIAEDMLLAADEIERLRGKRCRGDWIKVEDRPPTWRDGKVLIYTCYGISVAEITTSGKWRGEHAIPKHITHWMPQPKPPKEEKGK